MAARTLGIDLEFPAEPRCNLQDMLSYPVTRLVRHEVSSWVPRSLTTDCYQWLALADKIVRGIHGKLGAGWSLNTRTALAMSSTQSALSDHVVSVATRRGIKEHAIKIGKVVPENRC